MKVQNETRVVGKGISNHLPGTVTYFKETCLMEDLTIPCQKPNIEDLLDVTVACEIADYKLIETAHAVSYEGQYLSGHKLIVSVLFKMQIKYVAQSCSQTIHAAHFDELMKNVFIIVPEVIDGQRVCDLIRKNKFSISCYIEDVYAMKKDDRTLLNGITFLVDAKFF